MVFSSVKMSVCSFLFLALFTTCCMSWPTEYRRSYNYVPQNLMNELQGPTNPWQLAQEPYALDDQPEPDYYVEPQWADIEALSNILEMYDENSQQPMWGQIVREKPETELEELKQLSYRNRDEKRAGAKPRPMSIAKTEAVFTTTTSSPATTSRPSVTHLRTEDKPSHVHGQKEIPLLRPPNPVKQVEPAPIITQRSLNTDRKPSPYDTLRKYLSIEDALKKEAEKRRAPASSSNTRQVKRSYVMDEESLTGQLNSLKKSVN